MQNFKKTLYNFFSFIACGFWSWNSLDESCSLFETKNLQVTFTEGVYSGWSWCRSKIGPSIPSIYQSFSSSLSIWWIWSPGDGQGVWVQWGGQSQVWGGGDLCQAQRHQPSGPVPGALLQPSLGRGKQHWESRHWPGVSAGGALLHMCSEPLCHDSKGKIYIQSKYVPIWHICMYVLLT